MKAENVVSYLIDVAVVGTWISVNVMLFSGALILDESVRDLAMRAFGTLDAALVFVLAYHRGSSSGSRRKTEIEAERMRLEHDSAAGK